MPIKNRPNREEVRSSIMLTARNIAAADGWSAVTVRKVAERIGYTAPIIYEHFGSKDEMLNQILKEGYDTLFNSMREATEKQKKPEDRMREVVMAFWDFSHDNTEVYQLMYGMEGARATSEQDRDYALPLVKFVTQEMIRFDPGRITPENVVVLMVEAWSAVHGMISLDISGYVGRYMKSDELPGILVDDILNILKRQ